MTDDRGVYIGMYGTESDAKQAWYGGERHVCLLGPNGSGKGAGLIMPNLATLRRSVVIIDPKGECAAVTAERRREFSEVWVVNPSGMQVDRYPDLKSDGFNPLLAIDPQAKTFIEDITATAEALVVRDANGKDPLSSVLSL
jgi:type IV secretion system protein VirD4